MHGVRAESGPRADWLACTTHISLLDCCTTCTVFHVTTMFTMATIAHSFTVGTADDEVTSLFPLYHRLDSNVHIATAPVELCCATSARPADSGRSRFQGL